MVKQISIKSKLIQKIKIFYIFKQKNILYYYIYTDIYIWAKFRLNWTRHWFWLFIFYIILFSKYNKRINLLWWNNIGEKIYMCRPLGLLLQKIIFECCFYSHRTTRSTHLVPLSLSLFVESLVNPSIDCLSKFWILVRLPSSSFFIPIPRWFNVV